jgi:hypothetical protein
MSEMKRRQFIALLGSAAMALPLAARAQQSDKTVRVGFFGSNPQHKRHCALIKNQIFKFRDI